MEGELWKRLYAMVMDIGKEIDCPNKQIHTVWIVLTFLWAVLHDRPVSWACQMKNWPAGLRWCHPPSPATMSRRLRACCEEEFFQKLEQCLREVFPQAWVKWIDARPLPVGGNTKDKQARFGRGAGLNAKGYKLYMLGDAYQAVESWQVQPMNVSEKRVAVELFEPLEGEGYVVGDGEYDANVLYDSAAAHGFQLVANKRKGEELGHRRQSPYRLRALELISHPFGQALLRQRSDIERYFGQMSNFGGGLSPLPNWVRTLGRVRLWVQGKIIINTVRIAIKQRLIA
jgi:hypothetical protein